MSQIQADESLFELVSDFTPQGDQPQAIEKLIEGINNGEPAQVLLGVTGSGKTFTMANVIAKMGRPTLILSHNKTLAAQLYAEFKKFFPNNAVEYFISYYDYYQPEAFIPSSGVYIEKDLSINQEIEKLRLAATSSLASGRRDVIVVASVSCIYGIGNPEEFTKSVLRLTKGQQVTQRSFLMSLVEILYSRTSIEFTRGTFRVKGDTVDVFPAYADFAFRFVFWGDEIESIHRIDPLTGQTIREEGMVSIFPANLFVTGRELLNQAIHHIQDEMVEQEQFFKNEMRLIEAQRIKERVEFDIEMMRELGYCSGIENYSCYFDGRRPGQRPFCLIDYFPDDFLFFVDESHVTLPQVRAMWGGDRSRKENLVEYGFRLPSALDNRPLKFDEFQGMFSSSIYVSATPGDYEMRLSEGVVVEQLIRPTGLLDPQIVIRPTKDQVNDLLDEINDRVEKEERVLVTTLTKRMAVELSEYLLRMGINAKYIHSEVKTLDRVEIIRELRLGIIDVIVGVNLLREGLDLPEVSLVAIMDADKEGFLRDNRSLIQTIGRAARNVNGTVIMYADKVTESMRTAIDETDRRRAVQEEYNTKHGIVPKSVTTNKTRVLDGTTVADKKSGAKVYTISDENMDSLSVAEPLAAYLNLPQLEKLADETKKQMMQAAEKLDFMTAAKLRDQWQNITEEIKKKKQLAAH